MLTWRGVLTTALWSAVGYLAFGVHLWLLGRGQPGGIGARSEFDLFRTAAGERGYNAWLDRIADTPANGPSYGLAHLLDGEIAVRHVLARIDHEVPRYTVDAVRWRDEVVAHQGEHDTWFAGAWLGEGLHEGAIRSASDVAEALGGASIMQLAQQPERARRRA